MAGGRKESVDDKEILRVFEQADDPILFTREVAEEIEFSSQGTLPRLRQLEDRGLLASKKGGKALVWWITEEGEEFLDYHDRSDGQTEESN